MELIADSIYMIRKRGIYLFSWIISICLIFLIIFAFWKFHGQLGLDLKLKQFSALCVRSSVSDPDQGSGAF